MSDKKPSVIHVYDGIEEEDNKLPNWWLAILFITIVFSFGYWFVYHTTKKLPVPTEAYRVEVEQLKRARMAANPTSEEALLALAHDPGACDEGSKVYASTCASCHGLKAEGLVGPNLTDKFWLHGGSPKDLLKSITDGYAEKGMPPWGPILGAEKTRRVTAFLISVRNTNVPGKAPQGDALE